MSTPKSDSSGKSSGSVGSYSFIHDHSHRPRNGDSSSPDSVPDAKWWLNHYGIEKGLLEVDAKLFAANYYSENSKSDGESNLIEGYCSTESKNGLKHPFSPCKSDGDSWLLGFESAINIGDLLPDLHSKGSDSDNCFLVEQPEKLCSDLDSQWIGVKKVDPWWHAVYKDDLASLNSQYLSHDKNSNCDHLGVQSVHDGKASENCVFCLEKQTKLSDVPECAQGSFSSVSTAEALGEQGLKDPILHEPDRNFSDSEKADPSEAQVPNCHLSRGELLEALCHSQTRAREAEKLAQEACDEKEHVFDLFFQQASCLFAYKQWLRILQLETLCLHLRSKDHISSFTPPSSLLPKGASFGKNGRRGARKKVEKQRFKESISKCAVAFAVGLGLAGAGLLVGWTVGWLFPAF